ncbi:RluA family pseudouridine synthase [Halobacillus campisalis]|uniref:Pseudouridine synthase n=1 Tax=Halobacillus campisalis TaxID=435909 RepID=A0ABW2JYM3_9BACI|nr:RluA family pseudouridine synthase [Halobacillus campisalis]
MKNSNRYRVDEPSQLLEYLFTILSDRSRNSVKTLLARGQVSVDGQPETAFNYKLQQGQMVEIGHNRSFKKSTPLQGLKILHEDEDLIIIDKSSGLLSVATAKEKQSTAYRQLTDHVKNHNPKGRIFIVHRLDRETSGVMMFAKNEKIKRALQNNWKDIVRERIYMALVEGEVQTAEGTISSWLKESKSMKMHSSQKPNDGQYAVTHYKRIQWNSSFSLLEVQLETGRKNQIRVHMEDIGHPIAGDKKYGAAGKGIGRLGLHAKLLTFQHPATKKLMRFKAETPEAFYKKSK